FYGRNREKRFAILPSAVFIQYYKYERYENLREDFIGLLSVYLNHFHDAQPSRLGLRYINHVQLDEPNPLDWRQYFNPYLLSVFEFPHDKFAVSRAFNLLEFAFEDANLRYQFGMHNPDY